MLLLCHWRIYGDSAQRLSALLDDDSIILRCVENRIESKVVHQLFALFCQDQLTTAQLSYQTPLAHIGEQGFKVLYCNLIEGARFA